MHIRTHRNGSLVWSALAVAMTLIAAGNSSAVLAKAKPSLQDSHDIPLQSGSYYEAIVPNTLDLAERATLGVNHLSSLISLENGYEMYGGSMFDAWNPPVLYLNHAALMCCQAKCMEALVMQRIASGSRQNIGREHKMWDMMASLIDKDGIYWVPSGPGKPWLGKEELRPYAHVHGQGRMPRAMMAIYQFTGDPVWKERVDRMVSGMDKFLVVHKGDYAYFPSYHGWTGESIAPGVDALTLEIAMCYNAKNKNDWKNTPEPKTEKEGEEGSLFCHQGHIAGVLANWYMLTGNKEALRLSGELVRFLTKPQFWADWPGGDYPGVVGSQHAHWTGHPCGHINVLRAILEYAIAVNDQKLKEFVRDGYDWQRQVGFAKIGMIGDGQGCNCGRLIGLAVKLSCAGVGDYWEDVDQYIRNHGTEYQITPEDIPYLKKRIEGKPSCPPQPSISAKNVYEASMGGFPGSPFKYDTNVCCSPHGNMGIFYAWDGILRYIGGVAQVNLLLNRASPWIDIDSYIPYEGKVVLRNKTAKEALVRIPLYVDKKTVRCRIGGRKVEVAWFNRYIRIPNLKPHDVVTIEFPLLESVEKWTAPALVRPEWPHYEGKNVTYTCRFKGNTLIGISPDIMPGSPLYKERAEKYKTTKAPMRKVTRFVTPFVLKW